MAMTSLALDELDRNLLAQLRVNARESAANLARRLGVARTTVLARLSRLERHGVIAGYTVRLSQDMPGGGLQACVGISLQPRAGADVLRRLSKMPEIHLLCTVSGEFDYVAWLHTASPEQLDALLDEIGQIDGVTKTTTSVVLARKIDRGTVLP
ncbi:Lrp/AsnC family transcriptional regulator [Pandoraea sp.]|uniref:Lrp/AsnC family transcriptional regulator n=1 Tax=Pandoraea sp. TaxID=1883445 RepID=UPI001202E244|nr:Lrp/AsnC family transcriptional regulator [Pandoraea sp.]TAL55557.1 MAG: Lrp/AsnC family transcriptional regulator [Pandoraea sp.]TAM20114.1 MAG: Lrp/AsnC family transcriptional regulator [Pandoraea sp.]